MCSNPQNNRSGDTLIVTASALAQSCRIASRRSVVLRALRVGLVVGGILIVLNQGDVLLSGDVSPGTLVKMILTPIVPYLVSTFSSVAAIREAER